MMVRPMNCVCTRVLVFLAKVAVAGHHYAIAKLQECTRIQ